MKAMFFCRSSFGHFAYHSKPSLVVLISSMYFICPLLEFDFSLHWVVESDFDFSTWGRRKSSSADYADSFVNGWDTAFFRKTLRNLRNLRMILFQMSLSSRARSVAVSGRSGGSFARACMIAFETLLGIDNAGGNGGGGSDSCLVMTPETVSASNGSFPE